MLAMVTTTGRAEETTSSDDATDEPIEEMVVFGIRTGAFDPVPGASTDVLFMDDFSAESKDLSDLLSASAGVHVRRFGGAGDRAEVSIRGSTPNQVVVTLDGVRVNSALTGGLDLSRICVPLLDRVEIIRGAGGTQEGSGALGGVVRIVTRSAGPESKTRVAFETGSFETFRGSLMHSGSWQDLDYSAGYCGFSTQGDFKFTRPTETIDDVEVSFEPDTARRLNNDRVQHAGSIQLGMPLAAGRLRLSNYGVYSSGGEPGTDSGNGVTAGQSTEARSRDWSNLAQLRWESDAASILGGKLSMSLHHRYEKTRFRDTPAVFREPIDVGVTLQTIGGKIHETWRHSVLKQQNELGFTLDFGRDSLRSGDQSNRNRMRVAGALEESIDLWNEKIKFSGSIRIDWSDDFDVEVLPAVGMVVSPWPWLRFRGQAGRAYRVPNFDELFHPNEGFIRGNPRLSPEDAWNFGTGFELRLDQLGAFSDLEFRAGWFRREIEESIVWILINPRTVAPVNTGKATTDGYELAASVRLTRFLQLRANYTRLDSRRDRNGKQLPGQPEEEIFGRLQLGPEESWKLVGEVQRVGEILVSEGGSRRLPARTVWNASAALNLASIARLELAGWVSEFWVYAAIDNITDEAVRDSISFPQPGRHASAGFEAVW